MVFFSLANFENESFLHVWRDWIHNFVTGGGVVIKASDDVSDYFQTKKNDLGKVTHYHQLFNIAVDMLVVMTERAKSNDIHDLAVKNTTFLG